MALQVAIPRVKKDGAVAQLHPASAEQSMASALQRNETSDMLLLHGAVQVASEGSVSLYSDVFDGVSPPPRISTAGPNI